ncbi:hypothetical protein JYT48_02160 [Mariprofundus ferrooxydans]|nr:hypothetical protein [Mariprofundus ferrooxydans]MBN4077055.1 hypothetical protein [Mariprofundus ferrooxydans]
MNASNLEMRNVTPDFPKLVLPNGRPVTSIEVDVDSLQQEEKYQFGGWDDLIRIITAQWVQQNMYAGHGTIWQWGSVSVNFGQRSYSMFYVVLGMPKAFRQYLKAEIRVLGKHVRPHSDEVIPRLECEWDAMCHVEDKKGWESLDPTLWRAMTT